MTNFLSDGHYTRLKERHVWAFLSTRRSTLPFKIVERLQVDYAAFGIIPYSTYKDQSQAETLAEKVVTQLARQLQIEATLLESDMKHVRFALVLRRSSDWYRRGLHTAKSKISYLIVGTHDSCIPFSVYAMDCLQEFPAKATFYDMTSPEFLQTRCSQFGHNILLGGLVCGLPEAQAVLQQLKPSTQYRIRKETIALADRRYRSRLHTQTHLRIVS
jgi:hypothetical protein